ncbi:hypothetical protein GCM10010187_40690 [Actinomadura coerulea]|nr:hypothetical protein GCM10010187_40690 [Actinomadura coerulea]
MSLHVVYVVTPWLFDVPADPGAARVRERLLDGGRDIVELAVARARDRVPGLEVTGGASLARPPPQGPGRARAQSRPCLARAPSALSCAARAAAWVRRLMPSLAKMFEM